MLSRQIQFYTIATLCSSFRTNRYHTILRRMHQRNKQNKSGQNLYTNRKAKLIYVIMRPDILSEQYFDAKMQRAKTVVVCNHVYFFVKNRNANAHPHTFSRVTAKTQKFVPFKKKTKEVQGV